MRYRDLFEADITSNAFHRWFAGSKVIDTDGTPMMVFHGTTGWNAEIQASDHKKATLIDVLEKHGYDGLVYNNQVEHRGSDSWVIFRPYQVWPLFSNNHQ